MCGYGLEESVVDWVIDYPASVAVLQKHGIEAFCAGKSLEVACLEAGASPQQVLREIHSVLGTSPAGPE